MFNSADENNDGKINFQEFVKVVDNSQWGQRLIHSIFWKSY